MNGIRARGIALVLLMVALDVLTACRSVPPPPPPPPPASSMTTPQFSPAPRPLPSSSVASDRAKLDLKPRQAIVGN